MKYEHGQVTVDSINGMSALQAGWSDRLLPFLIVAAGLEFPQAGYWSYIEGVVRHN